MLEISFRLDSEEYELSAKDPIGNLTISEERSVLLLEDLYLDTCFAILTDACRRLAKVDRVNYDVEWCDLIIERMPDGKLRISCGSQKLRIGTLEAFEAVVKRATESFLSSIKALPDFDERDFPRLVQDYADWKRS